MADGTVKVQICRQAETHRINQVRLLSKSAGCLQDWFKCPGLPSAAVEIPTSSVPNLMPEEQSRPGSRTPQITWETRPPRLTGEHTRPRWAKNKQTHSVLRWLGLTASNALDKNSRCPGCERLVWLNWSHNSGFKGLKPNHLPPHS